MESYCTVVSWQVMHFTVMGQRIMPIGDATKHEKTARQIQGYKTLTALPPLAAHLLLRCLVHSPGVLQEFDRFVYLVPLSVCNVEL